MIVHYTNQFRKDYKVCKKRGYDMEQLKTIMLRLEDRQEIKKNKDHCLSGDFSGYRECHIYLLSQKTPTSKVGDEWGYIKGISDVCFEFHKICHLNLLKRQLCEIM